MSHNRIKLLHRNHRQRNHHRVSHDHLVINELMCEGILIAKNSNTDLDR